MNTVIFVIPISNTVTIANIDDTIVTVNTENMVLPIVVNTSIMF